ncbi:membrane protein insertase YidC [Ruminococcaceae bacterium OttesenSCG-928-L11]|nr:membrane protein insertase YidC [Ruminococcaceae bacterium OttesenSCG-928-L11]
MNAFNQILGYPLGWVMWALYGIIRNYGVALLVFTLLIKACLLPLTLKQQKSSAKMMMIQPLINDVQNRYKNDKEKLNEELMKLYQKEGYNPMSGCLPLLIQMPVLFGLIDVIYKPLYHILRLPKETIAVGKEILAGISTTPVADHIAELSIIRSVKQDPTPFMALGQDIIDKIQALNLNLFGMDLTMQPSMSMFGEIFTNFNPVILIPILSGVSALASSLQSMRQQSVQATEGSPNNSSMKGMMLMMPIFSTWIAFSVPAGVGLYWFYSNITGIVERLIVNRIYNPKEIAKKAKLEHAERLEKERLERIEAKKQLKEAVKKGEISPEALPKNLPAKEVNRKKLAEARKRDAEKYGEEYVEVTDEDLV